MMHYCIGIASRSYKNLNFCVLYARVHAEVKLDVELVKITYSIYLNIEATPQKVAPLKY